MFKKDFNKIYYSTIDELNNEEALLNAYSKLPLLRKEKADRYKNKNDKLLSIGVWLLLERALKVNGLNIDDYELCFEENEKPFLMNCPLYFSLSHSGNMVLVGISTTPIGVDIQEKREIVTDIRPILFNTNDELFYDKSSDKNDAFYTVWSYKESYLKMIGKGINTNLYKINIDYKNKKIESSNLYVNDSIDNYKICACFSNDADVSLENISIL